jgi:hypothetical protein
MGSLRFWLPTGVLGVELGAVLGLQADSTLVLLKVS